MAVFNRCSCKTFNSSRAKVCKQCGKKLSKDYYIQYTIDGKRKTEKIGDSIGYARDVLAKRKTDVREGKFFGVTKTISWTDFFDKYYRVYCENNLARFDEYRFMLARNYKGFDKQIQKIARTDIEKYRLSLDNGKRSKSTINRYIQVVKFAFNYAESLDFIDRNPARKLSMYKEEPVERRALSMEEEQKLLDACKSSNSRFIYDFVLIALYTGMRYKEILGLKWSNIDMQMHSIRLYKTKSNEIREIPIVDKLTPAFDDLNSVTGQFEYVFSNESGEQLRNIRNSFSRAVNKADIGHLCIHEMRHTMITRLAASGASVPEIQQISGHKTAKMVQRYTHVGLKEAQRTMNRLSEFLGASLPQ